MPRKIFNLAILVYLVLYPAVASYSSDFHNIRVNFLKGDYNACIVEGEKILIDAYHSRDADELYYLLATSYLKTGNYLRAEDIFEILIKEFKDSKFRDEAYIGLGDVCLLEGDFSGAEAKYRELLRINPSTKLISLVTLKLAQVMLKQGKWEEARQYLNKLNEDFPLSLERRLAESFWNDDFYFTIQVGSFSDANNAKKLSQKLNEKKYPAYVDEFKVNDKITYRVRVGKFNTRQEAEDLAKKLAGLGYPTKIFP
ncbi:MAG: tetratricopeptide repeat protein [Candidatus Omnitrophica bacterium]|nr:tetratricopeptide repeat protein [Candidatus Omnitrophota bacterium]